MFQGLTMDVIGRTAFGIQTDSQNNPNDPLLRSSQVFLSGDIRNPIAVLRMCFPSLIALWTRLNRIRLMHNNKGTNPVKELIDSVKAVIATRRQNKEDCKRTDPSSIDLDAEILFKSLFSAKDTQT
ncbi:cytochrome P450 3A28 [Caerostris extrusa]|uniref:Cytochrome P450 3A28 n=1 Tax=Caerostris extrusa TaxID=172846 RepID=A0AAV4Y4I5_CAEEX|nr:cytochrome P450 3A28 [Caerostris extrusa]